jgi:hypothetical protein
MLDLVFWLKQMIRPGGPIVSSMPGLGRVSTRAGKAFAGWSVDGRVKPDQDEKVNFLFASGD